MQTNHREGEEGENLEKWQTEVSEQIGKRAGWSRRLRSSRPPPGRSLASELARVLELSLGSALSRRLHKLRPSRGLGCGEREVGQTVHVYLVGSLLRLAGHVHPLLGGDELDELVAVLTHNDRPAGGRG